MQFRDLYWRVFIFWFCFTVTGNAIAGIDPVKVMSYNLLNYPNSSGGSIAGDTALRNPNLRTIMAAANPDILVVQELLSQAGLTGILNNVMNKVLSGFAAGMFIDGPDSDNGILYRTSKFSFISNTRIITDLRDINEFKLKHILSGDTIRIYSVHLKASGTLADEAQRAVEVDSLRNVTNALPFGSNFIICGDFNIYNNSESAYIKLKEVVPGSEGHFIDALNLTGTWNNAAYALYHTQSTRISAFGGGSTGGMDDRFDMILYSKALSIAGGVDYSSGSMLTYGNDGLHFNDSINDPPNNAVGQTVANALHLMSDHAPVMATLNFNYANGTVTDFGVVSQVMPSGSFCPVASQQIQVTVINNGNSTVDFSSINLPVELKVTNPSAGIQTFNKTISSGTLAAGSTLVITFDTPLNMTQAGVYIFKSYTQVTADNNNINDTLTQQVTVNANPSTAISPAGPLSICKLNPVTLTASPTGTYLWSNGATTASISVAAAGSYSVKVTNANNCSATSTPVVVTVDSFRVSGMLYNESFGAPTASQTLVNSYTGWRNGPPITYSSTSTTQSDIRYSAICSLTNALDSGSVFMGTATATSRNLIISGINTLNLTNLKLNFNLRKDGSGTDTLLLEVSSDGTNYTPLYFTQLTAFTTWTTINATGTIPSTSNLRIRFSKNSATTQFRIDDVQLTYSIYSPLITAGGPTTFCAGSSVALNSTSAVSYLWSNGATTQNVNITSTGNYSVFQTSSNGCTAASNIIGVTVNSNSIATVSLSANLTGAICAGTPVTFTAAPVNGGTITSFNFKVNNVSKQNGSATTFTSSTLVNSDAVKCEMTGNKVCTTPATAISNVINMNITATPTWYLDHDGDGYYKNGTAVTQCNSPGTGYITTFTGGGDCNDNNASIYPGLAEICGNGVDDNCNGQIDEGCSIALNLKLYIEGFYAGGGLMVMGDTVTVELRSQLTPFNIVDSAISFIDVNGNGTFHFYSAAINSSYYLVVRHRNSMETWSKFPVLFGNYLVNYDFTAP